MRGYIHGYTKHQRHRTLVVKHPQLSAVTGHRSGGVGCDPAAPPPWIAFLLCQLAAICSRQTPNEFRCNSNGVKWIRGAKEGD